MSTRVIPAGERFQGRPATQPRRTPDGAPLRTVVPSAPELEEALVGAVLVSRDQAQAAAILLVASPEAFLNPVWRLAMAVVQDAVAAQRPFDYLLVAAAMEDRDPEAAQADKGGPVGWLLRAMERARASDPGSTVAYARVVADKAAERALLTAVGESGRIAMQDHDRPTAEKLAQAAEMVLAVQAGHARLTGKSGAMAEGLAELAADRPMAIPTGTPEIDQILGGGGLVPSRLMVVSGPTGTGKSWLALSMVVSALKAGVPVVDFSLEMTHGQRLARLAAILWGGDWTELLNRPPARWGAGARELWQHLMGWEPGERYTCLTERVTAAEVAMHAKAVGVRGGVVVVDYYQNLRRPTLSRGSSMDEADESMSGALEDLARTGACTVIAVSQLTRAQQAKYGANLEMRADVHLQIDPVKDEAAGHGTTYVNLRAIKNRWAPDSLAGGEVKLAFDKTRGRLLPPEMAAFERPEDWRTL